MLFRSGERTEMSRVAHPGEEDHPQGPQQQELVRREQGTDGVVIDAFGYDDRIGPEGQQDEEDQTFTQGQIEIPPVGTDESDDSTSGQVEGVDVQRGMEAVTVSDVSKAVDLRWGALTVVTHPRASERGKEERSA